MIVRIVLLLVIYLLLLFTVRNEIVVNLERVIVQEWRSGIAPDVIIG